MTSPVCQHELSSAELPRELSELRELRERELRELRELSELREQYETDINFWYDSGKTDNLTVTYQVDPQLKDITVEEFYNIFDVFCRTDYLEIPTDATQNEYFEAKGKFYIRVSCNIVYPEIDLSDAECLACFVSPPTRRCYFCSPEGVPFCSEHTKNPPQESIETLKRNRLLNRIKKANSLLKLTKKSPYDLFPSTFEVSYLIYRGDDEIEEDAIFTRINYTEDSVPLGNRNVIKIG
jgi:hypothetical protein